MRSSNAIAGITVILLLGSAPAIAAEEHSANPWAGSALRYGHEVGAFRGLGRGGRVAWLPYYAHGFSLQPAWRFRDHLRLAARIDLSQALTRNVHTARRYEWVWTDLAVDLDAGEGYAEPLTGIRVTGGLRVNLPASKISRARTLVLSLGPGAELSRRFAVLQGLTVGYRGRWSYHLNRMKTVGGAFFDGAACGDPHSAECELFIDSGTRNTRHALLHGPIVALDFTEALSFSFALNLLRRSLEPFDPYRLAHEYGWQLELASPAAVRSSQWLTAELGYQAFETVGIALGVVGWLNDQPSDQVPFVGRYLDVSLNLSWTPTPR